MVMTLLIYACDVADLVQGNPDEEGAVSVRRPRLLAAENLTEGTQNARVQSSHRLGPDGYRTLERDH